MEGRIGEWRGRNNECGSGGVRAVSKPRNVIIVPMTILFCRREMPVQEVSDDWLVHRTAGIVHAIGVFVKALFV